MYLTLRRYAGAAERMNQIAPKVGDGLVPILKRSPGFKGYCAVGTEGGDGVSVTLFDSADQAAQANQQARSWVRSEMRDLLPNPPAVFAGPVAIQAGADGPEARFGTTGEPLYVVIRKFENIPEPNKSEQFTRDVSIPAQPSSLTRQRPPNVSCSSRLKAL